MDGELSWHRVPKARELVALVALGCIRTIKRESTSNRCSRWAGVSFRGWRSVAGRGCRFAQLRPFTLVGNLSSARTHRTMNTSVGALAIAMMLAGIASNSASAQQPAPSKSKEQPTTAPKAAPEPTTEAEWARELLRRRIVDVKSANDLLFKSQSKCPPDQLAVTRALKELDEATRDLNYAIDHGAEAEVGIWDAKEGKLLLAARYYWFVGSKKEKLSEADLDRAQDNFDKAKEDFDKLKTQKQTEIAAAKARIKREAEDEIEGVKPPAKKKPVRPRRKGRPPTPNSRRCRLRRYTTNRPAKRLKKGKNIRRQPTER